MNGVRYSLITAACVCSIVIGGCTTSSERVKLGKIGGARRGATFGERVAGTLHWMGVTERDRSQEIAERERYNLQ